MVKPTLLVIEPDHDIADALRTYLSKSYKIIWTQSAAEAIALTGKKTFDAVVLELALGNQHSGLEFLHEFKSYPDTLLIPVIVLSQQQLDEISLKSLGVTAYLYKPQASLEQVAAIIAKALQS